MKFVMHGCQYHFHTQKHIYIYELLVHESNVNITMHLLCHGWCLPKLYLKFVAIWKIKFMYLKVGEMFLQVFRFFFMHLDIDVANIPI
jgi:hypothetical protein